MASTLFGSDATAFDGGDATGWHRSCHTPATDLTAGCQPTMKGRTTMPQPPIDRRALLATLGLAGIAVGTRVGLARQTYTSEATPGASPAASPAASPIAGQAVKVELGDYTITPATTTFAVHQPYTFVVTNGSAKQVHEFVLERSGAHDEPLENAAGEESEIEDITPGSTREMTWTFTEAGAYQLVCYVANHAELGMIAQITVKD